MNHASHSFTYRTGQTITEPPAGPCIACRVEPGTAASGEPCTRRLAQDVAGQTYRQKRNAQLRAHGREDEIPDDGERIMGNEWAHRDTGRSFAGVKLNPQMTQVEVWLMDDKGRAAVVLERSDDLREIADVLDRIADSWDRLTGRH